MINITLKGGDVKQVKAGTTIDELCRDISMGLYRVACAATLDGELVDLMKVLDKDGAVEIVTFDDEGGKEAYWHTSSHMMAQAVLRLFPDAKIAIGPSIDNGFYYDFDLEHIFTEEDLEAIAKEMKKISKEKLVLEKFELPRDEALEFVKDQPYKVELILGLPEDETISFYKQGEFTDLCAGPHISDTGRVKAIHLTNVTGAYWRGDSDRKMLQRIYGITFPKNAQLQEYLEFLEEARKRDHRKIGKELELFTFMEEGPGFPFFLPNGLEIKNQLIKFWRELHRKAGYVEVSTPLILSRKLWEESGHWGHYKDNMYTTKIDEEDYAIKPMNCPGGIMVYRNKPHSYRDLPIRMGELGIVHRHELSGALHGLMRVRSFTQDDAHIFMTPDQIKEEIKGIVRLIDTVYTKFGFSYHIELSTQPEDSMGEKKVWDNAIELLKEAVTEMEKEYKINEGDGAFYGPKLDFHLKDAIGRTWQCGTIQLDFQLPERFELEYIDEHDDRKRPIMLHRVIYGSIERFMAILIEHFTGAFPLWLSPEQVRVLPISEKQTEAVSKILQKLNKAGIRAEVDLRNEKIGYKIREAQLDKIPYMLIVGEREAKEGNVSVRSRSKGDIGTQKLEDFISIVVNEDKERV